MVSKGKAEVQEEAASRNRVKALEARLTQSGTDAKTLPEKSSSAEKLLDNQERQVQQDIAARNESQVVCGQAVLRALEFLETTAREEPNRTVQASLKLSEAKSEIASQCQHVETSELRLQASRVLWRARLDQATADHHQQSSEQASHERQHMHARELELQACQESAAKTSALPEHCKDVEESLAQANANLMKESHRAADAEESLEEALTHASEEAVVEPTASTNQETFDGWRTESLQVITAISGDVLFSIATREASGQSKTIVDVYKAVDAAFSGTIDFVILHKEQELLHMKVADVSGPLLVLKRGRRGMHSLLRQVSLMEGSRSLGAIAHRLPDNPDAWSTISACRLYEDFFRNAWQQHGYISRARLMSLHTLVLLHPQQEPVPVQDILARMLQVTSESAVPMLLSMHAAGLLQLERKRFAPLARQLGIVFRDML